MKFKGVYFTWESVPEMAAWVGLFLLIPGTILGYFAELSHPGDTLYPFKQNIERLVDGTFVVYNTFNALGQIDLANKRFAEANKLLLAQNNAQKLNEFTGQVEAAEMSIDKISDPAEKKRLQAQLLLNIAGYQTALNQIKLINHGTTNSTTIASNQIPPVNNANAINASPTPTPSLQQVNTNIQIDTTQEKLQQIETQLQIDQNINEQLLNPTPTPTPTITPTNTPIPLSTPTPTPDNGNQNPPSLSPTDIPGGIDTPTVEPGSGPHHPKHTPTPFSSITPTPTIVESPSPSAGLSGTSSPTPT